MTIDISYNSHGENLILYAIILDRSLNIYSPESNSFIDSSNAISGAIFLDSNKFNSYNASIDSSSFETGSYIIKIYQRDLRINVDDNEVSDLMAQSGNIMLVEKSQDRTTQEATDEDCHCVVSGDSLGEPGMSPSIKVPDIDSFDECIEIGGDWDCSGSHNYQQCRDMANQVYGECVDNVPDSWFDKLNVSAYLGALGRCRCQREVMEFECKLLDSSCSPSCLCHAWRALATYVEDPENRCWDPRPDDSYPSNLNDVVSDLQPEGCYISDPDVLIAESASLPDFITNTLLHVSEFNWDAQLQREVDSLDSKYYLPELLSYDVDQIYIIKVDSDAFYINDKKQPTIKLKRGGTYRFDQSHSTNTGDHLFRISTSTDGIHNGGIEYSSGVSYSADSGTLRSYTTFEVPADAPSKLYYYCKNNPNMGGVIEVTGGNINDFGNNNIEITTKRGSSDDDGIKIITR
ncbi:hypothetical protein CL614_02895 [archaeon]|nr:hypothetical protein [archaeon]|tara:strand:+ start:1791 stop:3173 length:1383 start_codon:yes stop_codon:yes gene_type:complete